MTRGFANPPFIRTTMFSSFFTPSGNSTVDYAQMIELVSTGGGNGDNTQELAPSLVAAYFNASSD